MRIYESETKTCSRCGHIWNSYTEKPVRCPGCGTYHWEEQPTINNCVVCGHKWFSRTTQIPIRCPKCKTRSWKDGEVPHTSGHARKFAYSFDTGDVSDKYEQGIGCVSIAMQTGLSIEKVITIIRSEIGDGQIRM